MRYESALALDVVPIAAQSTAPAAVDAPIVFAATNDSSLPLAGFRDNQLTSGILKDLGDAIAAQLHRKANYVVLPRKRLDAALESGMVDGVCYYRPEWVSTQLNWSQPLIPNDILLVAGPGVPKPRRLEDVAGKVIGVVLGYKYPELGTLHQNYQREDAPNMPSNIGKLVAGRVQYAVIDGLSLQYQQKLHPEIGTLAALSITKINAECAFSRVSKIPFVDIDAAIRKLAGDGGVERILRRYH
jgi:polar amino acid transport system substrate-binding protein